MNWTLPDSVNIAGTTYAIRTDYRCILDILTDLANPEVDGQERALIVLIGFYPDFSKMPPEHYQEAIDKWTLFINCGSKEPKHKAPKLVD